MLEPRRGQPDRLRDPHDLTEIRIALLQRVKNPRHTRINGTFAPACEADQVVEPARDPRWTVMVLIHLPQHGKLAVISDARTGDILRVANKA